MINTRLGKRMKSMVRFRRRTKPGAAPGTIRVDPQAAHPVIRVISYGPEDVFEQEVTDPDSLVELIGQRPVTWIDVQGLGDAATIEKIGKILDLHPLALEDVVNTHQRAKVEDYGEHLFIVARMVAAGDRLDTEQVGLFLGGNYVLTFQEKPGDCLDPVRKRIRSLAGRIRRSGSDYLAYALLDAVVDAYFPLLEHYGEQLDALDEEISRQPAPDTMTRIHGLRSELLLLRRAIWPFREAIGTLLREPHEVISEDTQVFLRDCYDHTVQIVELLEICQETCVNLREYYLSALNNRMSEVMKLLTIIATIFIPLSFIAGLYGMNFDPTVSAWNMPELHWPHGYPFALGLMGTVAGCLLLYFWRRGWLGG